MTQFKQSLTDPTPDEIRQKCFEIQMHWTREQEKSRRVEKEPERYVVPDAKFPSDFCFLPRDEVSY